MTINFSFDRKLIAKFSSWLNKLPLTKVVTLFAITLAFCATAYSYNHHTIIAYGDAESHLNIAKRVIHSLTPGAAQLGGIWLPLPHILMLPLVYFDFLWKTGLAGSIPSGICFIISAVYIYKLVFSLTEHKGASFLAATVFMINPNILYMQSTPMTELPLIVFFILNAYFFIRYLQNQDDTLSLILSAFYGFCATLTRYDGWGLVMLEAGVLGLLHTSIFSWFKNLFKRKWAWPSIISQRGEGLMILYCTLALFGIVIWLGWGALILGNPLYFTQSQFSAKSQQNGWLAKKQLPSYKNFGSALTYYSATAMSNTGVMVFTVAIVGLVVFIIRRDTKNSFFITLVLLTPFIFYILTLFIGQSLIFIPSITPVGFEWRLFNVRYGVMMIPACAILFSYLFSKVKNPGRLLIMTLLLLQVGMYFNGYSPVITYDDGTIGLSASKHPDAEQWLAHNYDNGLIAMDDYKRIFSVISSNLPMQNIIYIGNKPYWEETLEAPQSHAQWLIIQKDDALWHAFYDTPEKQGRLYAHYRKVYTSDDILIFERNL